MDSDILKFLLVFSYEKWACSSTHNSIDTFAVHPLTNKQKDVKYLVRGRISIPDTKFSAKLILVFYLF